LKLDQLKSYLLSRVNATADEEWKAFYGYLAGQIGQFREEPADFKPEILLPPPPGQPIGSDDFDYCGHE